MTRRWDNNTGREVESPAKVEAFLDELEALYRRHGMTLGHDDSHGVFHIEPLDESNIEWVRKASLTLGK